MAPHAGGQDIAKALPACNARGSVTLRSFRALRCQGGVSGDISRSDLSWSSENKPMTDFAQARRAMVNSQVRINDVTDYRIQDAMAELPREKFVPVSYTHLTLPTILRV